MRVFVEDFRKISEDLRQVFKDSWKTCEDEIFEDSRETLSELWKILKSHKLLVNLHKSRKIRNVEGYEIMDFFRRILILMSINFVWNVMWLSDTCMKQWVAHRVYSLRSGFELFWLINISSNRNQPWNFIFEVSFKTYNSKCKKKQVLGETNIVLVTVENRKTAKLLTKKCLNLIFAFLRVDVDRWFSDQGSRYRKTIKRRIVLIIGLTLYVFFGGVFKTGVV